MQDHRDVSSNVIYQQALILTIKIITVQEKIRRIYSDKEGYCKQFFLTVLVRKFQNKLNLKKDTYTCFGFEWKQCEDSPLDVLDESNCPIIAEQVPSESNAVRIELDD